MNVKAARWSLPERLMFLSRSVHLEQLGPQHVPDLWRATSGAECSFEYLR